MAISETKGESMRLRTVGAAICVLVTAGCASESAVLTNDSGQSFTCQNSGWGWLGAPVAMANQSDCIKKANAAGYHEAGQPAAAPANSPKASPTAGSLGLAFPEGWQTKPLNDAQRKAGFAIAAGNNTTDSEVVVSAAQLQGITDRDTYVASRRAALESRLKESTHTDIADISVNGRPARQYQVTGVVPAGVRMTYLETWIFGQTEVVLVNTWTTAPNFDNQRAALQALAERVSGIQ